MRWRAIPFFTALCVLSVGRILHDSMVDTAPAAVAEDSDPATDLSRVDFTSWLKDSARALADLPTTRPVANRSLHHSSTVDQSPAGSLDNLADYFPKFTIERSQGTGQATASNSPPWWSNDLFTRPAIDTNSSSAAAGLIGMLTDSSDFSGGSSSGSGSGSSRDLVPPSSSTHLTTPTDPAISIASPHYFANTPVPDAPEQIIALPPPPSVPEPNLILLPFFLMLIGRRVISSKLRT